MGVERPDWAWYQRAIDLVATGDLDGAERAAADSLAAGHLWRESLLRSPQLDPLRGRPLFERVAADARARVAARHLEPLVLTAAPRGRSGLAPLVLVLHGATGNAATELARWQPATEFGFTVVAAQSSQPATEDGFCWDPPRERVRQDLRAIADMLPSHARVVLAGFSQGAWVALNAAMQADVFVAGSVLMFAPFAGPDPHLPPAWRRLRISMVVGGSDMYRARVEGLAQQLSAEGHHVALEVVPNLGHEYPPDFVARLPKLLRP
jgi:predicted esterase